MIILFFARRFYPLIGGVEKHVLEISKILAKRGYKVVVITENYQSLPTSAIFEGIQIYRISTGGEGKLKKFRIWLSLIQCFNVIKSSDIVHCHDIFFWYLPFRFLFPSKKVYTTFHGYEGNKIPGKKEIFLHKLSEKLSYGNICVGDYLKKWYGTKPDIVTYGAVDLALIKKHQKEKKDKKSKIVFIGRLEEEAGIMKYLKAVLILKDKGVSVSLDVFGQGSQETEAKAFSTQNNLPVRFMGVVKSTEIVLNNYEYIFCSRYLGVLESMAANKPVFVEYNNSIKKDCFELAPFRNFIYLSDKPETIANDLIKVLNNPKESESKVKNAYEWVKNQTWERMVNNYLRLWGIH